MRPSCTSRTPVRKTSVTYPIPRNSWLFGTCLAAALGCSADLGPTGAGEVSQDRESGSGLEPETDAPLETGAGDSMNSIQGSTGGGAPMKGAGGSDVVGAGGGDLPRNSGGGTPSTGGAPGAGGGSSNSGGTTSSGGASGTPCEYPAGPYKRVRSLEVGDVLPPDLTWAGYDLEGNWRTVTMAELHDCDGSQGRNALVFRNIAAWCGVCSALNRRLNSELDDGWRADGVEAYVLVSEDAQGNEADEAVTRAYYDAFEPNGWAVLLDPDWTFLGTVGGGALPMQIVVDPRTMTLQGTTSGGADVPNGLTEVLERNR